MKKLIKGNSLTEFFTREGCYITEIINDKELPAFSVAMARVQPGVITETHALNSTDEVYYILSGRGEMEVGGEMLGVVQERDCVFIPRNSSQRIRNIENHDLVFLCICVPRFETDNYVG